MLVTDLINGFNFSHSTTVADNSSVTVSSEFAFNVPSGILGSLATKALPLNMLIGTIYLEIELNPVNVAFIASNNCTLNNYTVSDLYFNAKITQLDRTVEKALGSLNQGGIIVLPAIGYASESKTIAAGSKNFVDKFGFSYASVKGFFWFLQNQASSNAPDAKSVSSRHFANVDEFYLQMNGQQFPSQPIKGYMQSYMNLLRSYDLITDPHHESVINRARYISGTGANGEDTIGTSHKCLFGIDLDRYNYHSDLMMSGTYFVGSNLMFNSSFTVETPANMLLRAFVMKDVSYIIVNNMLSYES